MPTYVDGVEQGGESRVAEARGARGFTASDLYTGAVGTIQGDPAGFSACVLVRLRRMPTTREIVFGTFRRFIGGGWAIAVEAARAQIWLTQTSDGAKLGNFVGGDWTYPIGKVFFLHFVWDGTTATLYVNGRSQATVAPTGGITFEPAVGPALGIGSEGAEPFVSGSLLGAAYGTQVMSAAQVQDHVIAAMSEGRMVDDPGTGFSNLWTFDGAGSAPTVLVDQIGNVDLTLTGSLLVDALPPHWL